MTDPAKFQVPGGLDDVAAKIVAAQIDADVPDAPALCTAFGWDVPARVVAAQIAAGKPNVEELTWNGLDVPLAEAIATAIKQKETK